MKKNKKIILASGSPRRKELLSSLNLVFDIIPSDIDENIDKDNFSKEVIENLAYEKAKSIADTMAEPTIVIGADTVVVIGNKVLGKPEDEQEAFNMLKNLSGIEHEVTTAIAIIETNTGKKVVTSVTSKVKFKKLTDEQILNYIKTGEPMDKAGSYAIQGGASNFVDSIEGCYNNIVGLSTDTLKEMLVKFDIKV